MTFVHGSLLALARACLVAGSSYIEPRSRTLPSILQRVLVPRLIMLAVGAAVLGLARPVSADPSAQPTYEQAPSPMPSWTEADQRAHPRCLASAAWPKGRTADVIITYSFRDHVRRRVAFAEAWKWNHNRTEVDDIWVLGICPDSGRESPCSSPAGHRGQALHLCPREVSRKAGGRPPS